MERLDWRCTRRDESHIARRLWKKQAVDAIYSLEEGAILDEFVHFGSSDSGAFAVKAHHVTGGVSQSDRQIHDPPQVGLDLMRQMARRLDLTNEDLVLLALELALAQREPQRMQQGSRRIRFVATGSFDSEKTAEVLRRVGTQASQATNPALAISLILPGRTHQALVYIIKTNNPHEILEVVSPFEGLVQWDISPAIEASEALPPGTYPEK